MSCPEFCRRYTVRAVELALLGSVTGAAVRSIVLLLIAESGH